MQKILLVEDHDDFRALYRMTLRDAGYDILDACDGKTALEIVREGHHFDLLLLDLAMPDMSGFELFKELRAEGVDTPVVFVTNNVTDLAEQRAHLVGALIRRKPNIPSEFCQYLADLFDRLSTVP